MPEKPLTVLEEQKENHEIPTSILGEYGDPHSVMRLQASVDKGTDDTI
jgi:hypothetical protein